MTEFPDLERLVLGADGAWRANGEEITHGQTLHLFNRILHRETEQKEAVYRLKLGHESKLVTVEDTPCFVRRLEGNPATGYTVSLTDGTSHPLDPGTLTYRPGRLTCRIPPIPERGFPEGLEAKFLSAPYFEILQNLAEDNHAYWIEIMGRKFALAPKI